MADGHRTNAIRSILLQVWDPLGVGDNDRLSDEYDAYIPAIIQLLDSHGTGRQIERYLLEIEEKWDLAPETTAPQAAKKILEAVDK